MNTSTLIGHTGESIAATYLKASGYTLLERNARFGRYEIDLIFRDPVRKMIVFVEVKARSTYDSSYPIRGALDIRKRRALRRAIARWVQKNNFDGPARIDLVCVADGAVVEHLLDIGSDFL